MSQSQTSGTDRKINTDAKKKNANYGSKARGGLARQEAVDGKGYLSRVSFLCSVDFSISIKFP